MLVAVYGSLRKGLYNHTLIEDSQYIGTTSLSGFKMFDLGAFPAITKGDGEIEIEVYEVTEGTFGRLDRLEGYPNFYNRIQVDTEFGEAWVYFIANTKGYKQVVSGNWPKYVKEKMNG